MRSGTVARCAAGFIAAVAWLGLTIQCGSTFQGNHSVSLTLWIVFAYFTILTNLLVAVVFTALAVERTGMRASWIVAGTMLSILLVGIIYALLLHGTMELSGGSAVANVLNHMATPVLVPLFWIIFTPKGQLRWSHPLVWAIYPLAYLAYSLIRGGQTGKYPYPFLDPGLVGWRQTMLSNLAIAVAFLICSYTLVALDHRLARRLTSSRTS
ncbi:Pr6Pr family membrane protein [Granulicella sp. L46]|uniref:Pr6Pr family membrane protein n=1 Tax=Granulicella sp. L46 TaxID=1641865 RepID=UPI00131D8ACF|nr:Pr6Pr family membrane protein [Granulicella sp. L46]